GSDADAERPIELRRRAFVERDEVAIRRVRLEYRAGRSEIPEVGHRRDLERELVLSDEDAASNGKEISAVDSTLPCGSVAGRSRRNNRARPHDADEWMHAAELERGPFARRRGLRRRSRRGRRRFAGRALLLDAFQLAAAIGGRAARLPFVLVDAN